MSQASYFCTNCNKTRSFRFIDEDHQLLVTEAKNGLVLYSDIHICKDGLTAVNNLSIDGSYNIRSFEKVKLPLYRKTREGIPLPEQHYDTLHITQIPNNLELHLMIRDQLITANIKIGRFKHQDLIPITTLESDMGLIKIEVYPTGLAYTPIIEKWLQELTSILEILPPTTLGLLVDTFVYIAKNIENPPRQFDIKFLKTILASHEVYFILEDPSKVVNLRNKYGQVITDQVYENIDRFVRILKANKTSAIKDFTSNPRIDMDIHSLIYIFHILEDEGIISIERPGILEV